MIPELTPDQRQAIHHLTGGQPLRLVDPDTRTEYVLMRAEDFERESRRDSEAEVAATYEAQSRTAGLAGWDDPAMSDYDNYDENRKKQCP